VVRFYEYNAKWHTGVERPSSRCQQRLLTSKHRKRLVTSNP
jgi:hypothetical protein